MSMAALNHDWTDFKPLGGDDLAELIERVATLEAKQDAAKESLDETKAMVQHHILQSEFRYNENRAALEETNHKIDQIISGLAVKDAASKERLKNIAVAGGFIGAAAAAIGGFLWANAKAVVAFLATIFR